jgi:hypothetical protein
MAHTDACKIQVTEFVRKLADKGMSINKACEVAEKESDGIPSETIRRWWKEIKTQTAAELVKNDQPLPTPENSPQIQENQVAEYGGTRDGAGRPPKYAPPKPSSPPPKPISFALDFATMAISQLERIRDDDPKREDAFNEVIKWINNQLNKENGNGKNPGNK